MALVILGTINVRGIFENPASVSGFDVTKDTYPVPMNMIPVIKELIFTKEIKLQVPSDVTNDSVMILKTPKRQIEDIGRIDNG